MFRLCSGQAFARVVWWNDRRRGVRLGAMGRILGLSVQCTVCGHRARIRRAVALRLWGVRTFSRDVARDLRCRRCGASKACVQTITDTRPSESIRRDPEGGWNVGPRYPEVDPKTRD
jgi:hypothetical protein